MAYSPSVLQSTATCGTTNLALNKTPTASSTETATTPASAAFDENTSTRWASAFSDAQSIQVDLGSTQIICGVELQWEAAYGKSFQIQVSDNAMGPWTTLYSTTIGTGGTQNLAVNGNGRYVRMNGIQRGTAYGYSLFEFKVFGDVSVAGTCDTANAALNKTTTSSSTENAATPASAAFDGNTSTRWASAFSDAQSIQVDLGSTQTVCNVGLQWEAAYGKSFQIQVSDNATGPWTTLYSTSTGTGGTQNLVVSGNGRYVRMNGIQRGTTYGYSLYEFVVHTTGGVIPTLPTSDTPDFGSNVYIFDPTTPTSTIQSKLDAAFTPQVNSPTAQFGNQRYAFLFKPGTYSSIFANLGFYTSIAGLGINPDDVTLNNSDITVDAGWNYGDQGNATQNFWRSAENLAVVPSSGTDRWAVSQAAPFRRVHVRGSMTLQPASNGYSSGGYIADTKVDGQIASGGQQQWYTRDSNIGGWQSSVWNMVFSGVVGAPAQSFPSPVYTTLTTTPVSREKPYLYIDGTGKYRVFVPSLRTNSSGATWPNTAGASIPMSQFYVARPTDSTATLNAALTQGLNLFFLPGVYHLSQTLNITRANTVVTGLGFPTLIPDNGVNAMTLADVDGIKISSLLFDAGTVNSQALLTVGQAGANANHAGNPISIQDVYFRIGGAVAGKATNSLVVNSNNTIVDHIWAWRADHGINPTGWTINTADNGLVVNGNDVVATGLFAEHFQKYNVLWNGQNGKTIFFQNELPYDVPDQASWNGGAGYPAYKVADTVNTHEAWGLGSYVFFNVNPAVFSPHAFEVPNKAGLKFHDMVTVSLNNKGTIRNIINNVGAAVPIPGTNTAASNLISYP